MSGTKRLEMDIRFSGTRVTVLSLICLQCRDTCRHVVYEHVQGGSGEISALLQKGLVSGSNLMCIQTWTAAFPGHVDPVATGCHWGVVCVLWCFVV